MKQRGMVCRKKTYREKREQLLRQLCMLEQEQQQQTRQQQQHITRAHVLADLCHAMDCIAQLRSIEQHRAPPGAATQHQAASSPAAVEARLQVLLQSVPAHCCTADLLLQTTPELAAQAASLTAADISRLFTHTFYELLALLELTNRPSHQSAQAADSAGSEADESAAQHSAHSTEADVKVAVDRFWGIITFIMALHPLPLIEAMCLNHLTQQQDTPPAHHWTHMAQRVGLSSRQAAYLTSCCQEVQRIRCNDVRRFGQLTQHLGSPSLLLLAAQQQQAEQRRKQGAPPLTVAGAGAAAPPAAADEGGPVAEGGLEGVQLTAQYDHLATYGVLVALVVLDSLTARQKAQWLVASYPWVPGAVILCNCAAQQQATEQGVTGALASLHLASRDDLHVKDCSACRQRLQLQRQERELAAAHTLQA